MKKFLCLILVMSLFTLCLTGCSEVSANGSAADTQATLDVGNRLAYNQPTPTDIDYSLERYNLIKRTYWVNGQREKANALPCEVVKPLGYIVLFTGSGAVIGSFVVDGKVSSLNSFLTPDSEYYELAYGGTSSRKNRWLADVDGSYGENDNGIFFFTTDSRYVEWTGAYLYSDIPFEVSNPILSVKSIDNQ